ncbi:MAG: haloacid dehalogenase [Myxococcales bacterium]|nr:haloacid dehalogenase [Myxococcales bacterium]
MTYRPTVLLFDIDGTLVDAGGMGRVAMEEAFFEVCGRRDVCSFTFAGQTDRIIAEQGLKNAGMDPTPERIQRLLSHYLAQIQAEIDTNNRARLYPGTEALLARLCQYDHLALGLGTGNMEAGAFLKLRAAGLGSYFSFGGYGSDHEDRAALIRAGFQRGTTQLGCEESSCRRVVIGDTRLDVAAAKANNAETLGVLTGGDTREELVSAGAECIVETLEDPRAATFLVGA